MIKRSSIEIEYWLKQSIDVKTKKTKKQIIPTINIFHSIDRRKNKKLNTIEI